MDLSSSPCGTRSPAHSTRLIAVPTTEPLVNLARTSKLCDVPTRVFKGQLLINTEDEYYLTSGHCFASLQVRVLRHVGYDTMDKPRPTTRDGKLLRHKSLPYKFTRSDPVPPRSRRKASNVW